MQRSSTERTLDRDTRRKCERVVHLHRKVKECAGLERWLDSLSLEKTHRLQEEIDGHRRGRSLGDQEWHNELFDLVLEILKRDGKHLFVHKTETVELIPADEESVAGEDQSEDEVVMRLPTRYFSVVRRGECFCSLSS